MCIAFNIGHKLTHEATSPCQFKSDSSGLKKKNQIKMSLLSMHINILNILNSNSAELSKLCKVTLQNLAKLVVVVK